MLRGMLLALSLLATSAFAQTVVDDTKDFPVLATLCRAAHGEGLGTLNFASAILNGNEVIEAALVCNLNKSSNGKFTMNLELNSTRSFLAGGGRTFNIREQYQSMKMLRSFVDGKPQIVIALEGSTSLVLRTVLNLNAKGQPVDHNNLAGGVYLRDYPTAAFEYCNIRNYDEDEYKGCASKHVTEGEDYRTSMSESENARSSLAVSFGWLTEQYNSKNPEKGRVDFQKALAELEKLFERSDKSESIDQLVIDGLDALAKAK